jgi:hypothetical protein
MTKLFIIYWPCILSTGGGAADIIDMGRGTNYIKIIDQLNYLIK